MVFYNNETTSIPNSSPFKNGNLHLKMELESKAFFLGIFH